MKLLLCGGGSGVQTALANKKLNEIINHSKPILYIPLAMKSEKYDSCYEWIKKELKLVDVPYIEMIRSIDELISKNLHDYSALFIGGGNTFKLLNDLKVSGAFSMIEDYINNDGIVFGGSAGAIIFGRDLDACKLDDENFVDLEDTKGYDVLGGISLLCHYTNRDEEKDNISTKYLLSISDGRKIIALPEEDTIFLSGSTFTVIGTRPYYIFENGVRKEMKCNLEM